MSAALEPDLEAGSCPSCGANRPNAIPECMTCGVIFAKARPRAARKNREDETVSASVGSLYAAPNSSLEQDHSAEIWRDKDTLVVSREAELPDRCVRCNSPADRRLKRKLSWHPAGWYLLILFNLIIYFIASLFVSKTVKIEVPLCQAHQAKRRSRLLAAWCAVFGGLFLFFSWAMPPFQGVNEGVGFGLILGGALLLILGLVAASNLSQLVAAKRIEKEFVWLRKCDEAYLASFPEAPAGFSR